MIQVARVVSVDKDIAKVEIQRVSACGDNCGNCKGGCTSTKTFVEVDNSLKAKAGQYVKIEMKTNTFMKVVALSYIFPLIMLITGVILGTTLYDATRLNLPQELFAIMIGLLLMTVAYFILRLLDRRQKESDRLKFTIREIV